MKLPSNFFLVAGLAILFPVNMGMQVVANSQTLAAQPAPQLTPGEITNMPVRALPIRDFKLLNSTTGWVSTGNRILLTNDDGAHWKDISPPNPNGDSFASVFFHNADTGWVLFAHQTEDGEDPTPDSPENERVLYVRTTSDGGATWGKVGLPAWKGQHGLTGDGIITFADRLHGWISLNDARSTLFASSAILSTSDGGKTWNWVKSGIDGTVKGILAVTDKDIWMVGLSGEDGSQLAVSHDGGESFQDVVLPAPKDIAPFVNPEYDLPVFSNRLNGYVVVRFTDYNSDTSSSAKVLFATQDSGHTWKLDRILSNVYQDEVLNYAVVDDTWILSIAPKGSPSALVKVRHGGRSSVDKHSLGEFSTCRLSFLTQSDGWKSCTEGIFSTIDGGASWTPITPRTHNGVLTTDPVTPARTGPVTMKAIPPSGNAKATSMVATASTATAPGGGLGSGIDQHLGFDISAYIQPSDMQKWWDSSPYYDAIFYVPGAPSHQGTKQFDAAWVSAITAQGWGLIPTWVGYQSFSACRNNVSYPDCSRYPKQISPFAGAVGSQTACQKIVQIPHQYDPQKDTAWNQGICQADEAIAKLKNLGFDGTIAYLDVEGFVPSAFQTVNGQNYACGASVQAYVGGWVQEMHTMGALAGVYGSASNVTEAFGPENPDEIYIAGGKKGVTVWGLGTSVYDLKDSYWPNKQRIHQYKEETTETWGGLTKTVDLDIVDATIIPSRGIKQIPPTMNYQLVSNGVNGSWLNGIANGVNKSGFQDGEAAGFLLYSRCSCRHLSGNWRIHLSWRSDDFNAIVPWGDRDLVAGNQQPRGDRRCLLSPLRFKWDYRTKWVSCQEQKCGA